MITALIVAGGRGHRLGGPIPKQYRLLGGIPIIRRTIMALQDHQAINHVQVVIHSDDHDLYHRATAGMLLPAPLPGGNSRQDSVRLGLEGIASIGSRIVIIHDAVRPFVAAHTITAVIAALEVSSGAIAGVPLADTLKRCQGDRIVGTVERTDLWRAQTPQGFRFADILAAHRRAYQENPLALDLTDDAAVAERAGFDVTMVPGSDDNFKITTEDDLRRAEFMLQRPPG
ncbi:MAG: 2-C-methyl-D-erythritol 4-phosphate cytidylyltransferase [Acidiphilium sp.]|nr:2-C-methyl-D-erythritol 4-phosphate cytidylyltransferase [Acidiphilium sp.]MDD4934758.1 2-C-methyl-D-erythritol 4-phosphate cytidylyltransferase [Acidiphilium sp.]